MREARAHEPWYRHRAARALLLQRCLPWFLGLNVAWEIAQLPLYTIWREASPGYIAFAVAHCTAGDMLIGAAALALALVATRAAALEQWQWAKIAAIATLTGVVYTVFSEWTNTSVRGGWQYSELMPKLELAGVVIGLSPLAQWLVLPPLALYLAQRRWIAAT
ncbi:MAG: hypothetical protein E6H63_04385 [Betaproteobacteria bacterium]|nr:MAG: hypothetical protein E6H63_04385 [Betaproteobacteria bacterium]